MWIRRRLARFLVDCCRPSEAADQRNPTGGADFFSQAAKGIGGRRQPDIGISRPTDWAVKTPLGSVYRRRPALRSSPGATGPRGVGSSVTREFVIEPVLRQLNVDAAAHPHQGLTLRTLPDKRAGHPCQRPARYPHRGVFRVGFAAGIAGLRWRRHGTSQQAAWSRGVVGLSFCRFGLQPDRRSFLQPR
jgi:hypothetical protein